MIDKYINIIEEELSKVEYPSDPSELYEPIDYILSLGGKRIRPVLCLMAAELYEQDLRANEILKLAIALEVFHNFSLVHDDIMDEAPLRRGKETVHTKWNRDIAILSGDVMLVQAYQFIIESRNTNLEKLISQFNSSAIKVCEGQQFDMNYETSSKVSIEDYLKMIGLKTAELIACSLKMGAIASNASDADAHNLYSFGLNLGIAFQIQDDYLDAFGDASKVGKQIGGDILANKKTYLMLKTLEMANEMQKADLERAMNYHDEQKIASITELFEIVGVKEHTSEMIEDYFRKAMDSLEKVSVTIERKSSLKSLASKLMQRDH